MRRCSPVINQNAKPPHRCPMTKTNPARGRRKQPKRVDEMDHESDKEPIQDQRGDGSESDNENPDSNPETGKEEKNENGNVE